MSERQLNVLVGGALMALLPLAWLQYRWISEVSEAERDRRRSALQAALERIAADTDRDAGRLHAALVGAPGEGDRPVAERFASYTEQEEGVPVARILLLRNDGPSGWRASGWDAGTKRLIETAVPSWWRGQPFRDGPIHAKPPALLGPAFGESQPELGFVVIELDAARIESEYVPSLVQQHLGEEYGKEFAIQLAAGPAAREADASTGIFRQLRPGPNQQGRRGGFGKRKKGRPFGRPPETSGEGIWRLEARHKDGSLEAAVARTRMRNLLVSGITVVLLGLALSALAIALRRSQQLARLQLEFTAGVSHELRTPLAVIVSAGDNLADGFVRDAERVREYGALVRDEGTRLTAMVDQVLRFSEFEADRVPLEKRPVRVADTLAAVEREMRPLAEEQGCEWDATVVDGTFAADAANVHAALRNLVENALRHGGGKWIGLRAAAEEKAVVFSVEDRGTGIPPADLPHIFEPFYRGADSRAVQRKGSGLGLALVDRIARVHGGSVRASNKPDGGARFELTFPRG